MIFSKDIEFNATKQIRNGLDLETENKCKMRNLNHWEETNLVNERRIQELI